MLLFLLLTILQLTSIISTSEKAIYKCPQNSTTDELKLDLQDFIFNFLFDYEELEIECYNNRQLTLDSSFFPNNNLIKTVKFSGFSLFLKPNFLINLKSLQNIKINHCSIIYMSTNSFNNNSLKSVDLSRNDLKIVTSDVFGELESVNLSFNLIESLNYAVYKELSSKIHIIDLTNNPFACDCENKWIFLENYNVKLLKIDAECEISNLYTCPTDSAPIPNLAVTHKNVTEKPFTTIHLICPLNIKSSANQQLVWISPNHEIFSRNHHQNIYKNIGSSAGFFIQPLFIETIVSVDSNNRLQIIQFRGYFYGNWECRIVSQSGVVEQSFIYVNIYSPLYELFIFTIIVGFSVAGIFLFIAIIIGLTRYLRETSCCRKKIDYDNSELFEKRFVNTVIPVPYEGNDDFDEEDDEGDEEDGDERGENRTLNRENVIGDTYHEPLNSHRKRHDTYTNNDVQLIFRDQKLAEEYMKILEELQQASDTGDEKFKDRLSFFRNRFSIDFEKMRFELKRGMESLKTNSSAAAHKLRKSVGQMRNHMRSFTEFCGTSSSLAQSISIVVLPHNHHHHHHHQHHQHHHGSTFHSSMSGGNYNDADTVKSADPKGATAAKTSNAHLEASDELADERLSKSSGCHDKGYCCCCCSTECEDIDEVCHENCCDIKNISSINSNRPCCDSYEKAQRESKVFRFFDFL